MKLFTLSYNKILFGDDSIDYFSYSYMLRSSFWNSSVGVSVPLSLFTDECFL
jgi:hypothetical protein